MNPEKLLPLLLDLGLKSAAVVLAALLAGLIWRRASAANRDAIWLTVLATLLLLPLTRLAHPHWTCFNTKPAQPRPTLAALPPNLSRDELPTLPEQSTVEYKSEALSKGPIHWAAIGVVTWISGAAFALLHRAAVSWKMLRLARRSRRTVDDRVLALARESAGESSAPWELRESELCPVPLVFGIWRSVILLPVEARAWTDERLSAVFLHEFGHMRRRDCLTRLLMDFACAIYWVNPLVWIAAREMRVAQEQACDDIVLSAGISATDYASQIVEIVRKLASDRFTARHALAMAQPSTLETRVRAIVDSKCDRRPLSRIAFAAGWLAILTSLALCGAMQLRAADEEIAAPKPPASSPSIDPNGPKVEISAKFIRITDDHAASFLRLPAQAEERSGAAAVVFTQDQMSAAIKALNGVKGVDLLSETVVSSLLINLHARIEAVDALTFPTQWERKNQSSWKPGKFKTENVGVTFDVDPSLETGGMIRLHLIAEVVSFDGLVDLDAGGKATSPQSDWHKPLSDRFAAAQSEIPAGHHFLTVVSRRKTEATVREQSGQTVLVEFSPVHGSKEEGKADAPDHSDRLILLVTARLVGQGREVGGSSAEFGKLTQKSDAGNKTEVIPDTVSVDRDKGALPVGGNVTIKTGDPLIATDKAVINRVNPAVAAATLIAESARDNQVLATVNDQPITAAEVTEATLGADRFSTEARKATIEKLIDRALLLQSVKKMGYVPFPKILQERVKTIVDEEFGGDQAKFEAALAKQGYTLESFNKKQEGDILASEYRRYLGKTAVDKEAKKQAIETWLAAARAKATITYK